MLPGASVRIRRCPGLAESSDAPRGLGPNRALPEANGELRCSPGLAGFQRRWSCHSSTSPHQTGSLNSVERTLCTRPHPYQLSEPPGKKNEIYLPGSLCSSRGATNELKSRSLSCALSVNFKLFNTIVEEEIGI